MASILGKLPDFLYERPDGVVRVRGTKLLLEGVIYLHRAGISPEEMPGSYSNLDVGVAAKIVDYYERNRVVVDEYVAQTERDWEENARATRAWQASPEFQEKRRRHIEERKRKRLPPYDREDSKTVEVAPRGVR